MENLHFTPEVFADQATLNISKELLSSVANFEGFREKAYKCPSGVLTVGFGHTHAVTEDTVVPLESAKALLCADLLHAYHILIGNFPLFYSLPECYRNMLIDLAFNCGTSYFSSPNTELRNKVAKVTSIFHRKHNVLSSTADSLFLCVLRYSYSNGRVLPGLLRRRYYYVKQCIVWHEKNGYLQ